MNGGANAGWKIGKVPLLAMLLLVVAVFTGIAVINIRPGADMAVPEPDGDVVEGGQDNGDAPSETRNRVSPSEPQGQKKVKPDVKEKPKPKNRDVDEEEEPAPPKTEEERREEEMSALVDAFDDMTDKWREPSESDVPMEAVEKFRQQFNKIPKERQEECLHRALNLIPDENVMLLAGILLDKEQPVEYIELVYNDVLNRNEDVKKPLLKEIFKDRGHPCWADTAWILDVTDELPKE